MLLNIVLVRMVEQNVRKKAIKQDEGVREQGNKTVWLDETSAELKGMMIKLREDDEERMKQMEERMKELSESQENLRRVRLAIPS